MVVGMVLLVVTTIYMVSALMLAPPLKEGIPSTSFWPLVLVVITYSASLVMLVRAFKGDKKEKRLISDWKRARGPIIVVGLTGLYVGIFVHVGYWISTFLYSFGLVLLFDSVRKRKGKVRMLVFSMVAAAVLALTGYILFEVIFDVRLPKGVI